MDHNEVKVGDRVFFDYPHSDFPKGPVTVIKIADNPRWYSNVAVKSDDGQVYDMAHYDELKPL
jgi:hypothetical protein